MSILTDKCILSLDAGGTTIKLGIVVPSKGVQPLSFQEVSIDSNGTIQSIEEGYRLAIHKGMECAKQFGMIVSGIAVSTPGPFDYTHGISLMKHKYAAIEGRSVRDIMASAAPNIPIRFIHDSHAFLSGEIQDPSYARFNTVCALMLGTGLGFALSQERKIATNEVGGPKVSIFRTPYLDSIAEDYLSKRGIMRLYNQYGGTTLATVKDLDIHARQGDTRCIRVFAETGWHAAQILAPIIRTYSIDCIILGGQISKAKELLVNPMQQRLHELALDCFVCNTQNLDNSPLIGAATLFKEL